MRNLITLIDLTSGARQTFVMGDPPLGAAFTANGQALIVTSTGFVLFDPASGLHVDVHYFRGSRAPGACRSLPLHFHSRLPRRRWRHPAMATPSGASAKLGPAAK